MYVFGVWFYRTSFSNVYGVITCGKLGIWSLYLFVEFVAGPEGILDGVLVVRGMEVEKIHTIGPQPLKGGLQLRAHTLRLQRLPVPGVGLGSDADCHTETENSKYVNNGLIFCKQN